MRILFITSYYPPSRYGWGYMQLCEEVVDGLSAQGHDVAVLTSSYHNGTELARAYPVHRLLTIDPDWHSGKPGAWQFFVGRRRRERRAVAHLRQLVAGQRPDVIFVWHTLGLSTVMLREAERLPGADVAYYLADYAPERTDEYIAFWRAAPVHWIARWVKQPLARLALHLLACEGKPISLQFKNAICVSGYVRHRLVDQGLIPQTAAVIRNGIDLDLFCSNRCRREFTGPLSLLYAGRLESHKGVHQILQALSSLSSRQRLRIERLTILGDGEPEYCAQLDRTAEGLGLSSLVHFEPAVPRSQMPALLDQSDVLILPSALEALSRMMQEAMAMGLLVIGTTTGGSGELLIHDQTGLAMQPGAPESLAAQLVRVIHEPVLAARLAEAGQQMVTAEFGIQRMIEQIERYLLDLVRDLDLSR